MLEFTWNLVFIFRYNMTGATLVVIFGSALVTINTAAILKCSDYKGALFHNGEEYIPHKEEPCQACRCEKGFPSMCRQLPCSPPPKNCKHVAQVEGCCKYLCLDKFRRTPGTMVENGKLIFQLLIIIVLKVHLIFIHEVNYLWRKWI